MYLKWNPEDEIGWEEDEIEDYGPFEVPEIQRD
jgi:hypothetical protein